MADDSSSPSSDDTTAGAAPALGWALSIVYHSSPSRVGQRAQLPVDKGILLGRNETCFGEGALDDDRISRSHAALKITKGGETVTIEDLGSSNGTFVNGYLIKQAELAAGAVIGVGSVLLLLHRSPREYRVPLHPAMVGVSHYHAKTLETIDEVALAGGAALILGETGVGKSLVAHEIHDTGRRSGPFEVIDCATGDEDALVAALFGGDDGPGAIERAATGTLVLENAHAASQAVLARIRNFVETGRLVPADPEATDVSGVSGNAGADRIDTRVVASSDRPVPSLADWPTVHVVALRFRLEDVPHLVSHFARKAAGSYRPVSYDLMMRLLRHGWPRNVDELRDVVIKTVELSPAKGRLGLLPEVEAILSGDVGAAPGDNDDDGETPSNDDDSADNADDESE